MILFAAVLRCEEERRHFRKDALRKTRLFGNSKNVSKNPGHSWPTARGKYDAQRYSLADVAQGEDCTPLFDAKRPSSISGFERSRSLGIGSD